jgi:hypothetical protein
MPPDEFLTEPNIEEGIEDGILDRETDLNVSFYEG